MLREVSASELEEWKAFYELEPFGEPRADLRTGIIASTIANVNRSKTGRKAKPRDFMPLFEERAGLKPKQSTETIKDALMSMVKGTEKK